MSSEPEPRHLRIATLQPNLKPQAAIANMVLLRELVEQLVAQAPLDIVVLPELFDGWYAPPRGADQAADARRFLANLARAGRVNVIGGSVDRPQPEGRPRNTCFVMDRDGNEIGHYDKRALFSHEADHRSRGDSAGVFEVDGFRVGVLICADFWHPEYAREMLDAIDVLCVPAKSAVPSDKYVEYTRTLWESLALTRAMESAVAVVVADWSAARHDESLSAGGADTRRTYYTCGTSTICDPGHRPDISRIQQTTHRGQPATLRADIDLNALAEYREYRLAAGLLRRGFGPV